MYIYVDSKKLTSDRFNLDKDITYITLIEIKLQTVSQTYIDSS